MNTTRWIRVEHADGSKEDFTVEATSLEFARLKAEDALYALFGKKPALDWRGQVCFAGTQPAEERAARGINWPPSALFRPESLRPEHRRLTAAKFSHSAA